MPETQTLERVRRDQRQGKAPTTQAGEFIREEIEHIRAGKHGARSAKQAIAIGLSKARRAGVALRPPAKGKTSEKARKRAIRDYARGHGAPARNRVTARRVHASAAALKHEGGAAVSHRALASQAHAASRARSKQERSAAAMKAVATKGAAGRSSAARKAARTRHIHAH
jgi:hypothetical protein